MFIKENVNPIKKVTSDCVIRAIARAESKHWLEVFDLLTELAREEYTVLNDKKLYGKYLDSEYERLEVKYTDSYGNKKRYTVKDVCNTSELFKGIYLVSIAGHLTCVINGNLHDIWDCSDKSAYKIWRVKWNEED